MEKIIVNVIGLGYIGLPTALIMANEKVKVIGTDYNNTLIRKLSRSTLTFDEVGIIELFEKAKQFDIEFKTEYVKANIYIIAVPTPYVHETKKIDPKYVISAVNSILDVCDEGAIICIESTISPGTIDKFVRPIIIERNFDLGQDIHLVHTPERIIPGNMIFELENNSRTIGCDSVEIGEKIKQLHSYFCQGEIILTDIRSAEMSKVVENTFRDINIAFANELAQICREDDLDVYEIIKLANMHPRVNILSPGPGVGGHCISVDPWFLVGDYPNLSKLISTAREVNDDMPYFVFNRLKDIMKNNNINDFSKVGFYGLTYKENVDDTRESPTFQLIEVLKKENITNTKFYDPFINDAIVTNQYLDFNEFINNIDVIVIMVSHSHIKKMYDDISNKIVFDTKNLFDDKFLKL